MKKIIAVMLTFALMLSVCTSFAFAEDKNDKPAFEKIGLNLRTLNLSEHSGEEFNYITQKGGNSTDSAQCKVTAYWTTVFDPEVGYAEHMTSFYVPENVFPENVQYSGSASLFEIVDGYEWRCIRLVISSATSFYTIVGLEDYYTLQQYDAGKDFFVESKANNNGMIAQGKFSIEYDRKEYSDCYIYYDSSDSNEGNLQIRIIDVFYRIPCGYDGCVCSLIDTRNMTDHIKGHINSDDVRSGASDYYFRMK